MTADLEFIAVMSRTILQLIETGGIGVLVVLFVTILVHLFGFRHQ
ncbi:MAG: hypothetical protein JWP25_366 [Bradyrhizobium sp.]|nr:hypothetical protein [Bradyrhizobium sp.]